MILVAEVGNSSSLWHQRLGHMNEKGMKLMVSKGKIPNLKHVDVGPCEHCIFGKQKKVSFSKTSKSSKVERLTLVHTDVWRPAPMKSLGCSQYYVTFIDDHTRKVWVYFLKNKSNVFSVFPLGYQLPEEVWSGNEVNLSDLKVFGCALYILLNSNSRDKLYPKAK